MDRWSRSTIILPKYFQHVPHFIIDFLLQRPPYEYDSDVLSGQDPISFHKVLSEDPRNVYDKFFRAQDQALLELKDKLTKPHEEL